MASKDELKAVALAKWDELEQQVAPNPLTPDQVVDLVLDVYISSLDNDLPKLNLDAYGPGDAILFQLDSGVWAPGHVTEAATLGSNLHIHVEGLGPKTIGNKNRVKRA